MDVEIRPLAEADLPVAKRVCHTAFGTFLGAPDPETFWADRDLVFGRHAAEHTASFAATLDGEVVGSNFATRWGSVGFFGPLSVRPDLQGRDIGQRLVEAVGTSFEGWGTRHNGLFTFAHSGLHVGLYSKLGYRARFLTAIMTAPARAGAEAASWSRYSKFSDEDRRAVEAACRDLTEEIYEGLDLSAEIRTVAARGLGDTVLLWQGTSGLAGFAVCHWGVASEAGEGCLFVKFGAARSGAGAEVRFATLVDACAALAAETGMPSVLAGVNLARDEAYRHMLARGFRTAIQGVTMHRPNEAGYSRPGAWVLDDWR
jgi:predicted N-acetyltransferase YhbS